MALGAGSQLTDKLRLVRELGHGAMGTVWLAEHATLGTEVAVKVLRRAAGDPQLRKRFRREAQSAARLDSPHIVTVFDFGVTDDDALYIVMERLHGEDLETRIERRLLSPEEVVPILRQIGRALTVAHERDVIHRDIKPANVFLCDVDGEPFVKVLDFGIAKLDDDDHGMTRTGALMGTPHYMSPEQLIDPSRVDHRTDLWALAVVAYQCLTGAVPFEGETLGALSIAVDKGERAALRDHRPDLPPALDAWLDRALARQPDGRFDRARELVDSFATAVEHSHVVVAETIADGNSTSGDAEQEPGAVDDPESESASSTSDEPFEHDEHDRIAPSRTAFDATRMLGDERPRRPWAVVALGVVAAGAFAAWQLAPPTSRPQTQADDRSAAPTASAADASSSAPPAETSEPVPPEASVPSAEESDGAPPTPREAPGPSSPPASSAAGPKTAVAAGDGEAVLRGALSSCWRQTEGGLPEAEALGVQVDIFRGSKPELRSGGFARAPRFLGCAKAAAEGVRKRFPNDWIKVSLVLPGKRARPKVTEAEVRQLATGCWSSTMGPDDSLTTTIQLTSSMVSLGTVSGHPAFRDCLAPAIKALRKRMLESEHLSVTVSFP